MTPDAEEPNKAPNRVLVIDDDLDFAESLRETLEIAGYLVNVALDADSARKKVATFQPLVALIDVRLGQRSGIGLIEHFKSSQPSLLCVMMSAYSSTDVTIEALQEGAYDYLRKPFHQEDLFATLERCLQRLALEQEKIAAEESLRQRNHELQSINERMQRVVAWMGQINGCETTTQVCELLLGQVADDTQATGGSVYRLQDDELTLTHEIGPSHAAKKLSLPLPEHSVFGVVSRTLQPLLVADVSQYDDLAPSGWDSYRGTSMMALPLLGNDGRLAGVIALDSHRDNAFSDQDRKISLIIVSYASEVMLTLEARERHARLEAEFHQAQKMESLGELTGGIAHDFNNILASIVGFSDLAILQVKDTDDIMLGYLQTISSASDRASDLITKMLAFSRLAPKQARPVLVEPLLDEVVDLLRATLPSSIELRTEVMTNIPRIVVDPVQLHQVVMNLCVNARDALDGSGRIMISADYTAESSGICASCGEQLVNKVVRLSVQDDGPGIQPGIMTHVFEPFYTTKSVGKGTGMGLSVIHGIVHDAGGHIGLESVVGEGTTFTVMFPPAHGRSHDADVRMPEETPSQGAMSGHILIVDDDAAIASMIGQHLENNGCTVTVLTQSNEAMMVLHDQSRGIDMLITDQTMPGVMGAELIRTAFRLRPTMPTILMTGNKFEQHGKPAPGGASGLIYKPFRLTELSKLIHEHIRAA